MRKTAKMDYLFQCGCKRPDAIKLPGESGGYIWCCPEHGLKVMEKIFYCIRCPAKIPRPGSHSGNPPLYCPECKQAMRRRQSNTWNHQNMDRLHEFGNDETENEIKFCAMLHRKGKLKKYYFGPLQNKVHWGDINRDAVFEACEKMLGLTETV